MSPPRVSVIVPVHNTEEYLDDCLESIRSQTLSDLQILCVDDGSTDGSLARLQAHASADPRVQILRRAGGERGPGAARNMALESATGDYIAFVDSDDRIRPAMLQLLTDAASRHSADIAMCMLQTFDDETEHHTECTYGREVPPELDGSAFHWRDLGAEALFRVRFTSCNKVYTRAFLEQTKIRYAEGRYYEDLTFTFRALLEATRLVFLRESLYLNRKERTEATTFVQGDRVFDALQSMEELRALLEANTDYHDLLPTFDAFEFRKLHRYLPKNDIVHIAPFYDNLREVARRESLRKTRLLNRREREVRKRIAQSNLYEYLIWRVWYMDTQHMRQRRRYAKLRADRQELLHRIRTLRKENRLLSREVRSLRRRQSFRGRWKWRLKRLLGERGTALVKGFLGRTVE